MRHVLTGLTVIGALAASATATMDLQLAANGSTGTVRVTAGATVTITIQFQGSTKAVGQLGGSISGTPDAGVVVTANNDFAWDAKFTASICPISGSPAANGGMEPFGSAQPTGSIDTSYGKAPAWASVATYTVTVDSGSAVGQLVLHLTPSTVGGYGPMKSIASPSIDSTIGTVSDVTLNVVAAPDMQALLDMAAAWGTSAGDPSYSAACDLNSDGWVDVSDLMVLVCSWGG